MSCSQMSGYSVTPLASYLLSSDVRVFGWRKLVKIGCMVVFLCLLVVSLLFSPSSASALGVYESPMQAYPVYNSYIKYTDGTTSTCKADQYNIGVDCPLRTNSAVRSVVVSSSSSISANAVMNFTVTLNGFAASQDFEGFNVPGAGRNPNYTITDQDITYNIYGSGIILVNLTMHSGDNGAKSSFELLGGIVTNTDYQFIHITGINVAGSIDATWFTNQIGQISSINNLLKSGITANVDMSSVNSAINNASQAQINATNNAANQAHKDSQNQIASQDKTTEAVNNQTKQDKEQYEQEKQEEQDRENQGKSDMDDATGIFNFNLLNPFAGIFGLFKPPTTCASIPTLARWVHSDTSTVCSWWSSDITSVLTPVFGIFSMMIVFGFLVRWLSGSSGNGTIDNGWDAEFYVKGHGENF